MIQSKTALLNGLSKIHSHLEESTGFIDDQFQIYKEGEECTVDESRELIVAFLDKEIEELQTMRDQASQYFLRFANSL